MALIPRDAIPQVLSSSDIIEVISSYLPLRPAGKNYKALCPFHSEKTPSFIVNPERQIFHCFGCGEGGNVITFVMKRENFSFPEAVRFLAHRAGVSLPFRWDRKEETSSGRLRFYEIHRLAAEYYRKNIREAQEGAEARNYLLRRGIRRETAEAFQLGYALDTWQGLWGFMRNQGYSPEPLVEAGLILARRGEGYYDRFRRRLIIPIFDVTGKIIAFGGRTLGDEEAKYINSPETPIYNKGLHLYGLNFAYKAIREKGYAIVVEGYFDLITLHQWGIKNAVASLGTSLTTGQASLLKRYTDRAILVFDPDPAGKRASQRSIALLINSGMELGIVILPKGEDPDSFVRKYGPEAFLEEISRAKGFIGFLLDRRIAGLDTTTLNGQVGAINQILPILNLIENRIIASRHLQETAERVGLSNVALVEHYNRMLAKKRERPLPVPSTLKTDPSSAEKVLLHTVLHYPEYIEHIKASLTEDDFSDPYCRRIFNTLSSNEIWKEGRSLEAIQLFSDEGLRRMITGFLAMEPEGCRDSRTAERIVLDCVKAIKAQGQKALRREIQRKLREVELAGDIEAAKRLLSQHPSVKKGGSLKEETIVKLFDEEEIGE